jgi:FSR family fosmidomycin resistance protein-like MFS transporter
MSYFSLGGNFGFALGPLAVTPLLVLVGTPGSLAFLVPGAIVGSLLWRRLPRLVSFRPPPVEPGQPAAAVADSWGGFVGLLAVICSRTFAFYTLLALVPLYFVEVLDSADAVANAALTAMLLCGAVGTLVGGRLADRIGRRPVLIASLGLQAPVLVAMTAVGSTVAAVGAAALFGFIAISSFSVTVVMGQEYLPSRIGLASGFTLGAAIGMGGLAAPVFGLLGETYGLRTAIVVLACLPAAGSLLALALPPAPTPAARAPAQPPAPSPAATGSP